MELILNEDRTATLPDPWGFTTGESDKNFWEMGRPWSWEFGRDFPNWAEYVPGMVFFSVQWQVDLKMPFPTRNNHRVIKLQVEAPPKRDHDLCRPREVAKQLSDLKWEVVQELLSWDVADAARKKGYEYDRNRYDLICEPNVRKHRSTSVFKVTLSDAQCKQIVPPLQEGLTLETLPPLNENIELVHKDIGQIVDEILTPFKPRIEELRQRFERK